jgi:hypothetical protein
MCQKFSASSCLACLNTASNITLKYFWCSKPGFCYEGLTHPLNSTGSPCQSMCPIGVVYSSTDSNYKSECDSLDLDVQSLIVTFVILIVCPLCVVTGCLYVVLYRCRMLVLNKVEPNSESEENSISEPSIITRPYAPFSHPFILDQQDEFY